MRRILALAALVLAIASVVAFTGAAAYAGGNGAQTFTQTFKNQTDPPFVDFVPCRDFQGIDHAHVQRRAPLHRQQGRRFLGDGNDDRQENVLGPARVRVASVRRPL